MSRLSLVVAAALASAMIVVAVTALDAVGADAPTPTIAQCLRDRGVLPHKQPSLAVARTCKQAVAPPADNSTDVNQLTACLRTHGAQPPSAAGDLKRWILQHQSDPAVASALKQCGMGPPAGCGD